MLYKLLVLLVFIAILCSCKNSGFDAGTVTGIDTGTDTRLDTRTDTETSNNLADSTTYEFELSFKPDLLEEVVCFDRKDIDGNILDESAHLIGFSTNNLYFSYDNEISWIYAIGDIKENNIIPIYTIPKSIDVFFEAMYNNNLLIGIGNWDDNSNCNYELFLVSPDKEKRIVYQCISRGYPTVSLVDHYAVVNFAEQNKNSYTSKLIYIDLNTSVNTTVETSEYTIENNLYNGTFTINAGGWDDGFCYEKVTMKNESMQDAQSGESAIYFYSLKGKKARKLVDYNRKVFYISGSSNCFITSDYSLIPHEKTGLIWVNENDGFTSYTIPGIVSGEDIRNSYRLSNDLVLVNNFKYYFIFNLRSRTYYVEEYEFSSNDPESFVALSIRVNRNLFSYMEPNDNKLIYHIFELGNY